MNSDITMENENQTEYNFTENQTLIISEIKKELADNRNFRSIKKQLGKAKLKSFINQVYPKYTIQELENIMGIPDSTLARWFKQLNIATNKRWHIPITAKLQDVPVEKTNITKSKSKIVKIKLTPELAYAIGFSLGDGSIQKYMVEVFNKDENLITHLLEYLNPYGTITQERRENGLWRLRVSSVALAQLIKTNKEIRRDTIDKIFQSSKLARKFIAAFWDAEGSVRKVEHAYYHIYLYNTDQYLLNKIGDFLKSKNIHYSELTIDGRNRKYSYKGRPIISRKIMYRLSIPKSNSLAWAKEIGIHMLHSKKKETIKDIQKTMKVVINE